MNISFPYASSGVNSSYIFELLVKAAELGQPDAQFQVGAAYATGVHLTQVLLTYNHTYYTKQYHIIMYMIGTNGCHKCNSVTLHVRFIGHGRGQYGDGLPVSTRHR